MTPSTTTLISPALMLWASGNPVVKEMTAELEHVTYARECDLVLVGPATANTIAKMAIMSYLMKRMEYVLWLCSEQKDIPPSYFKHLLHTAL